MGQASFLGAKPPLAILAGIVPQIHCASRTRAAAQPAVNQSRDLDELIPERGVGQHAAFFKCLH